MKREAKALIKKILAAETKVNQAENRLHDAHLAFDAFQQSCLHKHVDRPGSVFGETCLDCGLYLNNGG